MSKEEKPGDTLADELMEDEQNAVIAKRNQGGKGRVGTRRQRHSGIWEVKVALVLLLSLMGRGSQKGLKIVKKTVIAADTRMLDVRRTANSPDKALQERKMPSNDQIRDLEDALREKRDKLKVDTLAGRSRQLGMHVQEEVSGIRLLVGNLPSFRRIVCHVSEECLKRRAGGVVTPPRSYARPRHHQFPQGKSSLRRRLKWEDSCSGCA